MPKFNSYVEDKFAATERNVTVNYTVQFILTC